MIDAMGLSQRSLQQVHSPQLNLHQDMGSTRLLRPGRKRGHSSRSTGPEPPERRRPREQLCDARACARTKHVTHMGPCPAFRHPRVQQHGFSVQTARRPGSPRTGDCAPGHQAHSTEDQETQLRGGCQDLSFQNADTLNSNQQTHNFFFSIQEIQLLRLYTWPGIKAEFYLCSQCKVNTTRCRQWELGFLSQNTTGHSLGWGLAREARSCLHPPHSPCPHLRPTNKKAKSGSVETRSHLPTPQPTKTEGCPWPFCEAPLPWDSRDDGKVPHLLCPNRSQQSHRVAEHLKTS